VVEMRGGDKKVSVLGGGKTAGGSLFPCGGWGWFGVFVREGGLGTNWGGGRRDLDGRVPGDEGDGGFHMQSAWERKV